MCKSSRVVPFKLIVDNTKRLACKEHLFAKAVQAYWRACESQTPQEDDAIEFLTPLKAGSPRGLAQKAEILENMIETRRSPEQIASLAASIADDALHMSRRYLSRVG